MIRTAIAVLAISASALAQNIVPFASRDNVIELAIQNTATWNLEKVSVSIVDKPSWLRFASSQYIIPKLDGTGEMTVAFGFSVEKSAPVGKDHLLAFKVLTPSGESWTKEIRLSVAAPETFELNQNFPNPFNPTTSISYQLPANGRVALRIYDLLGREVATLVDEDQSAGHYEFQWDASRYASGMYIYELAAISGKAKTLLRKTMLLVK